MYQIRSSGDKKPITVEFYEEAKALQDLCKQLYQRELIITPAAASEDFNTTAYSLAVMKHYNTERKRSVDLIILGMDLADFENVDYSALCSSVVQENTHLADQYKMGQVKAMNALVGKFLKTYKGHDASSVKDELIKYLKKE